MKTLVYFGIFTMLFISCKKDPDNIPEQEIRRLPNSLASATEIDTVNATAVLPLYRGQDANGGDVYYIFTVIFSLSMLITLV